MSIKNWNAGIIRPVPVAPAGPFQDGAAPGVWTLDQVAYWQKQGLWPIAGNVLPVGLFAAGINSAGTYVDSIDQINISTTGNATSFGNLDVSGREGMAGCGSATRTLFAGGDDGTTRYTSIRYVTPTSAGNALTFGDLTAARTLLGGCSSSTRGLFGGGFQDGAAASQSNITYVTIASTGNSTFFGNLTVRTYYLAACSSTTRGIFGGGFGVGDVYLNVINYVTIATTGDATDFGDLTLGRDGLSSCSSSTRGVFAGGNNGSNRNTIDYITISSAGNAIDFGDLTFPSPGGGQVQGSAACSSSTRGVFAGGLLDDKNIIQYITIASTGNSADFGDLFVGRSYAAGASNVHGGL